MLDVELVDELFEISTSLGEAEQRIRAGYLSRSELLAIGASARPLIDRLQEVVEERTRREETQSVAISLARNRVQSAMSHGVWVANHAGHAPAGSLRRQLLWAAMAGQTAVELLTSPRHPTGIARA